MLLNVGFIVLREALKSGNINWVDAEIEMLHNVPSLIGEENIRRHEYYWEKERVAYIERISKVITVNKNALSLMNTFYKPTWEQIQIQLIRAGLDRVFVTNED